MSDIVTTDVDGDVDVELTAVENSTQVLVDPRLVTVAASPEALTGMRETTAVKIPVYFASLSRGHGRQSAAVMAGVSYTMIKSYRKKNKHFRILEKSAELIADARIGDNLMLASDGGSVSASALWLKRFRNWVEPEKRIKIQDDRPAAPMFDLGALSDSAVLEMVKILKSNAASKADAITVDVVEDEILALSEDTDYSDDE